MWKSTILLLAFFAGLAHAQPSQIGVYMAFDKAPPAPTVLRALQREASALLQPADVSVNWQMLDDSDGSKVFPAVFIVNFQGTCKAPLSVSRERTAYDPFERPARVGSTRSVAGRMMSRAEIQCDRVRQGLKGVSGRTPSDVFASALAKVVAHELYHFLAGSAEHSEEGLAKSVLGWDELGQFRTRFALSDLARLKRSLAPCSERNPCR